MTYQEVAQMIESIGLPYTYYSFPINQAPNLPYIVFYFPNSDDFSADNLNYVPITDLNIELYSRDKNFALEKQVEDVLKNNNIYFSKSETFINTENMYEVLYETQIVINE